MTDAVTDVDEWREDFVRSLRRWWWAILAVELVVLAELVWAGAWSALPSMVPAFGALAGGRWVFSKRGQRVMTTLRERQ